MTVAVIDCGLYSQYRFNLSLERAADTNVSRISHFATKLAGDALKLNRNV